MKILAGIKVIRTKETGFENRVQLQGRSSTASSSHSQSSPHPSTSAGVDETSNSAIDSDSYEPVAVISKKTKQRPAKGQSNKQGRSHEARTTPPASVHGNDLFQWELYNAMDPYHPTDWIPDFKRRSDKMLFIFIWCILFMH